MFRRQVSSTDRSVMCVGNLPDLHVTATATSMRTSGG
jgi:hypothetical protein